MPKKRKPAVDDAAAAAAPIKGRGTRRRLARLEKRLARLTGEETKRARQLDGVRTKIDEVRDRIAALEAGSATPTEGTAGTGGAGGPGSGGTGAASAAGGDPTAGSDPVPEAYCMREQRRVAIAGATLVVLRNGRRAYAGTCPDCGARVVAIVGVARSG